MSKRPSSQSWLRIRAAFSTKAWPSASMVILTGTLIRLPQLLNSLNDSYAFRQTQTAMVIRRYARDGIDLFHTPLPVFGPDADVPMEFPLFQGLAALLTKTGLSVDVAARTMGLIAFQVTAILLAVLVRRWHGRSAAITAVVLFEFLPFGLQWGASSMIDFFSVALALSMVLAIDLWFERGRVLWLAVGSVAAVLAFLAKSTTAPSWCILLLATSAACIHAHGWRKTWRRQVVGYALGPGLGLLAALGWTAYADHIKSSHYLTRFITSDALTAWNFGTIDQRLEPKGYLIIGERLSEEILGAGLLAIMIALAFAFRTRPFVERARYVAWIVAAISGPVIFFNLYIVHDYYFVAVYPAIVAVTAISLAWLSTALGAQGLRHARILVPAIVAVLLSTALTSLGRTSIDGYRLSAAEPSTVAEIEERTEPGELIVLIGCDWSPVHLYLSDREGVMFRDADAGSYWETDDASRYSLLVSCMPGLDPRDYLPSSVVAIADDEGGAYYLLRPSTAP